jgi:hypothetical protein
MGGGDTAQKGTFMNTQLATTTTEIATVSRGVTVARAGQAVANRTVADSATKK